MPYRLSDEEMTRRALFMIEQNGDKAAETSIALARAMLDCGDEEGAAIWKQIAAIVRERQTGARQRTQH